MASTLDRLITLSKSLEETLQHIESDAPKDTRIEKIFLLSSEKSDTAFEVKSPGLYGRIKTFIKRITSPKKYNLAENLSKLQNDFKEIETELAHGKCTPHNAQEFEQLESFASQLEQIRDHAIGVLKLKAQKANKKTKAELETRIESLQAITFPHLKQINDQIEQYQNTLEDFVHTKLDSLKDSSVTPETIVTEFTAFAAKNAPSDLSQTTLASIQTKIQADLERNYTKQLHTLLFDQSQVLIEKTTASLSKTLSQKSLRTTRKILLDNIEIFKNLESKIKSEPEKKKLNERLQQFYKLVHEIELRLVETTPSEKREKTETTSVLNNFLNNWSINIGLPTSTSALTQTVAQTAFSSINYALPILAYHTYTHGMTSLLSPTLLISLVTPLLAQYAARKTCEQLPTEIAPYAEPVLKIGATLLLMQYATPLVEKGIEQFRPTSSQAAAPLGPTIAANSTVTTPSRPQLEQENVQVAVYPNATVSSPLPPLTSPLIPQAVNTSAIDVPTQQNPQAAAICSTGWRESADKINEAAPGFFATFITPLLKYAPRR